MMSSPNPVAGAGRRSNGCFVALIATVLQCAGCLIGPKYHVPTTPTPTAYKEQGDWKTAQPSDLNLGGAWWTVFQDSQLDSLEQEVNVSNQNLKAAEAQYRQARAVLRYNRADYYPTVTFGPSASRARVSANSPTTVNLRGTAYNDFVLPFDFSYQADVWGRVRRAVESARGLAQASAADVATVNLSLHADLAIDYFQARTLDAEEKLLNSTASQYEQALQLTESRFQGGIASEVEVEQARTQLQTVRAQAIDVGVLRAQYEHAVAVLIGKPPAEFTLLPLPLTTPPPNVPPSVPSDLLERRPDIAAAERRVASANAQIGVAKSAYYPVVGLSASGGFESTSITTLLQGPSGIWSLGVSTVGTVFDVGRRRALNDQARAAYDYQVAAYRETVLSGFQEVEDSLAAVRILEREANVQDEAVAAAQHSLELSLTRYRGGVTSYLEVTTAQSAALADEVTAVNILGRRMASAVLLIQALGGGWDHSSLPQRPECCGRIANNNSSHPD